MSGLKDKIKQIPSSPGCYLFKNSQGTVIYVGKSVCLNKRVSQYFTGMDKKEGKIKRLVHEIKDLEVVLTETEMDALLLECRLIKIHKPYYNSAMKKDRQRPYLCIDMEQSYPGIYLSMNAPEHAFHIGCFYHKEEAMEIIKLISSIWKTPLCGCESFTKGKSRRACLNYHMEKCDAPCQCSMDSSLYKNKLNGIIQFLTGKDNNIIPGLKEKMAAYSEDMMYEKAAVVNRQIVQLEMLQKRAKKYLTDLSGRDYCVFLQAYHEPYIYLFYINKGKTLIKYYQTRLSAGDEGGLLFFAQGILDGTWNVEEDDMLTLCITSIGADKLYLDITEAVEQGEKDYLYHLIKQGYEEFTYKRKDTAEKV